MALALPIEEKEREAVMWNQDQSFWITVAGAAIVRLITADYDGPFHLSLLRGVVTAFTAVFAAVTFTEPVLHALSLPADTYKIPMAALMALTGEGLMRMVIRLSADWKQALEILKIWRGK